MLLFFNNLPIKGVKFCQNIIILNFVKIFQLICNLNQVELLSSKNLRLDFDWENSRWRMVKPSPKNTNEKAENKQPPPDSKKENIGARNDQRNTQRKTGVKEENNEFPSSSSSDNKESGFKSSPKDDESQSKESKTKKRKSRSRSHSKTKQRKKSIVFSQ